MNRRKSRSSQPVARCKARIGRATRNAHCSGARTASDLGRISQPKRMRTAAPASVSAGNPPPPNSGHSARATIAAFATVLPNTMVASNSDGCSSSRATASPAACPANWRARHLPSANSADSASAKKKLAPAKTASPSAISQVVGPMRRQFESSRPVCERRNDRARRWPWLWKGGTNEKTPRGLWFLRIRGRKLRSG